eukprot:1230109-Pleurochrysis_carterae.AAC.1
MLSWKGSTRTGKSALNRTSPPLRPYTRESAKSRKGHEVKSDRQQCAEATSEASPRRRSRGPCSSVRGAR